MSEEHRGLTRRNAGRQANRVIASDTAQTGEVAQCMQRDVTQ